MKVHLVTLVLLFLLFVVVQGKASGKMKPAFSGTFPHIDPPIVGSGKSKPQNKTEEKKDTKKSEPAAKPKRGDPIYSPGYESSEHFENRYTRIRPEMKTRKSDLINGPITNEHDENNFNVTGMVVPQGRSSVFGAVAGTAVSAVNAFGQTIRNWAGNNIIGMIGTGIQKIAKKFGQIKLLLFTQSHRENGELITVENVGTTAYDKGKELIFIIHGFTHASYYDKPEDNLISMLRIKDGFLNANFTSNLIVVDWTTLSSDATYIFSSTSTATVADEVSDFIVGMVRIGALPDYTWVRIVGHSLGAHASGIVGSNVIKKSRGRRIARIDGLDPAGPNFDQYKDSSLQISGNDASYVHIIHCNIKLMGTTKNRGSTDFYPNGGDDQSGCDAETLKNSKCDAVSCTKKEKRALGIDLDKHACNHVRCIDVYIESLTAEYRGCKCESWKAYKAGVCPCQLYDQPYMGYYCDENARGVYYLDAPLKSEYIKNPQAYNRFFNKYAQVLETKLLENNMLPEHLREAALKEQGLMPPPDNPPELPATGISQADEAQMAQLTDMGMPNIEAAASVPGKVEELPQGVMEQLQQKLQRQLQQQQK